MGYKCSGCELDEIPYDSFRGPRCFSGQGPMELTMWPELRQSREDLFSVLASGIAGAGNTITWEHRG